MAPIDPRLAEIHDLTNQIDKLIEIASANMMAGLHENHDPLNRRIQQIADRLEARFAQIGIYHNSLYELPNGERVVCDYSMRGGPSFYLPAQRVDQTVDETGGLPSLLIGDYGALYLAFGTTGEFDGLGDLHAGGQVTKVKCYRYRSYRFPTPWTVLDLKLLARVE